MIDMISNVKVSIERYVSVYVTTGLAGFGGPKGLLALCRSKKEGGWRPPGPCQSNYEGTHMF